MAPLIAKAAPPPAVHCAPLLLPILLALILRDTNDWGDDPQAWGGQVEEWGGEDEPWGGEALRWGTDTAWAHGDPPHASTDTQK